MWHMWDDQGEHRVCRGAGNDPKQGKTWFEVTTFRPEDGQGIGKQNEHGAIYGAVGG